MQLPIQHCLRGHYPHSTIYRTSNRTTWIENSCENTGPTLCLPDITTTSEDGQGMGLDFSDVSGDPIMQGITIAIAIMWSTNFPTKVY